MLVRTARALAFLLDASELHQLDDGAVRVRASASRCRDLPVAAAIDSAFAACAFLVAPGRALAAGHSVCFRDPRALRLLFAHAKPPRLEPDGTWFRFAAEHVAAVDRVEYLDTRPGHADVAVLRLRTGPHGLSAPCAVLADDQAPCEADLVGMAAHPYGRTCELLRHDALGNAARIVAVDAQNLTARLTAWRGCSGAPWCTADGVVGMQVRAHAELAYAQRGLTDSLRPADIGR
jgi:hypothetical protein